ncbi:MAG: hypothetical protein QOD06_1997 [Candidatus Binatota bacterium]|nr:hypothetical protein [Candidatus Binatota bacterium]
MTSLAIAFAVAAHPADAVTITAGQVATAVIFDCEPHGFLLHGDGFEMRAGPPTRTGCVNSSFFFAAMALGSPVSLSSIVRFDPFNLLTFGSNTYAFSDGELRFSAAPVELTLDPLETTFTMTGFVVGRSSFDGPAEVTVPVWGEGTARGSLSPVSIGTSYFGHSLAYQFAAPTAVPEPGTLSLLGVGAGLLLRRCRRWHRRPSPQRWGRNRRKRSASRFSAPPLPTPALSSAAIRTGGRG